MINEETLKNLYEGLISNEELTTRNLNNYGFNSKDLTDLINQGILERVKRGSYSFLKVEDLFYYGKGLIFKREFDKAQECFQKCYELDPSNPGPCFKLFKKCISNKDYESAFKYFDNISNTDNSYYLSDSNFYLYLLSIITDIPEKYREYARFLKVEDMASNIPLQNKIRIAVFQRKFPLALKHLNDLVEIQGRLTDQTFITKILLFDAIEVEKISKDTLINFAKEKNYKEIILHLQNRDKRHKLSLSDQYILKLARDLLSIQETGKIPQIVTFDSLDIFEAVDGYNYELALSLSNSYNEKYDIDNVENTINILLCDICNLIRKLKASKESKIDNVIVSNEANNSSNAFSDVVEHLMKSDLEKAFKALKDYLISINKVEYEFLIIDLIKLSLIEKDFAFTKPMLTLIYISRGNFDFNISNYLQEFYIALSQNKYDEARIYLDIISKSNKLGQGCNLIEGLQTALVATENLAKGKKISDEILDNHENGLIPNERIKPNIKSNVESNVKSDIISPNKRKKPVGVKNETMESIDNEKKFIESKHQLLVNGEGIILLKPMSSERRKRIHMLVSKYPDMKSFSIGEGASRQIVLRYKPYNKEYLDVKKLITEANLAYEKHDYDSCIEIYLQLLKVGTPNSFAYAKLGLAYMKKMKIEKAIEYLTVATALSKEEKSGFDFSDLILSLKGEINSDDLKPQVKMKVNDFDNDINKNYGIDNIDEITSYIINTGLDIESACENLQMSPEKIDIVRLIYAKQYFQQGDDAKGEEFLKVVERSDNKTPFTISILDEIRKNKRFYINRSKDETQKLSLTIKPKKKKQTL